MTNYEKIKSMNVDKMAEFLENNFEMRCELCPHNVVDDQGRCDLGFGFDCIAAIKAWLKAESEED